MSDAPWTKEQSEKWAKEFCKEWPSGEVYHWKDLTVFFEAGMKKAAEMIEASVTIVQMEPGRQFGWYDERDHLHHKYQRQAKLVNVKPIEKGKSDE